MALALDRSGLHTLVYGAATGALNGGNADSNAALMSSFINNPAGIGQ